MSEQVQESFTPTVESVRGSLDAGGMALQTRSSYQTAVAVNRERNLDKVLQRCLTEAAIAGDDFYYSWQQGGKPIEGLTIGAAQALARNFGNCALEVKVEETPTAYIFHGAFIDLETGFNLVRPFRQNKEAPTKKDGGKTYSDGRAQDVLFQIGTSKAMRNAALNAMPKWLTEKVIAKAKENVIEKIQKLGPEKAKAMILTKANALGIAQDRIESIYGKERVWDTEKIIKITSALRAVEDGVEKATDLFPPVEVEKEIKTETASMVSKPAAAEVKNESASVDKGAIAPAAEMKNQDHEQPREQVKHQSEQELFDEMMEAIKNLGDKNEVSGWKKIYNAKLEKLRPMFQNTVINMLSEKEAELNRPASDKKSRYQQFADFLESARTKKEVSSQVKAITQAENDGELSKDERVDLLERLNAKLLELK